MPVPENVIVMWPSTNVSIPGGWSRVTDMDTLHPKGTAASTNPGGTSGSATHTHSNSNHTHTTSHGHGLVTTGGPTGANRRGTGGGSVATNSHTHTGTPSNSGSTTGGGSDSWDSQSNIPNSYKMIFIKSDGSPAGLPDGCIALFDSGSAPTGWAQHGASVTMFPMGADGSGGDGSGTTGGNAHTHANSGTHTHSISSHTHASSGYTSSSGGSYGTDKNSTAASSHQHSSLSLDSGGSGTSGAVGSGTTGAYGNPEPPYHKLLGIENTSGGANDTLLTICMWLGALDQIPGEYNLCDGSGVTPDLRGKFIKFDASGGGDNGGTGGNATHTHTSPTHAHSAPGHTHAASIAATTTSAEVNLGGSQAANPTHAHTGTSPSGGAVAANAATVGSVNQEPSHRTIAFIQQAESIGVSFIPTVVMF